MTGPELRAYRKKADVTVQELVKQLQREGHSAHQNIVAAVERGDLAPSEETQIAWVGAIDAVQERKAAAATPAAA